MHSFLQSIVLVLVVPSALTSCTDGSSPLPALSRERTTQPELLSPGQHKPDRREAAVVGSLDTKVERGSSAFGQLVRNDSSRIHFKNEEGSGADRMMTARLRNRLNRLARLVSKEWSGVQLRVTEAWDEEDEHGPRSLHYEGRAADLTTSDLDSTKLGRLAGLAIEADLDWVYFEDRSHVHVSVEK